MADLVLSDGREISFDLTKVTHREFVAFWTSNDADEKDALMQKMCGLTGEEIDNLPEADWRKFKTELERVSFHDEASALKNSPSAST